ncbi:hypothetical protein D3C75_1111570 [compost metagenome]
MHAKLFHVVDKGFMTFNTLKPEEIPDLPGKDNNGNPCCETDRHRLRNKFNQNPKP